MALYIVSPEKSLNGYDTCSLSAGPTSESGAV